MYQVVTENPDTFTIEKRGEFVDHASAYRMVCQLVRENRTVWVVNTETGEIL